MISLIVGTITLFFGYRTFMNRKVRVSGIVKHLQYNTVLMPENGAKTMGLLHSIWGLIFIVLGTYELLTKVSFYNFFEGLLLRCHR